MTDASSEAAGRPLPQPEYQAFEIVGERGRKFSIVLPRDKGEFAAGVERVFRHNNRYAHMPHVGVLALDYLKRRGTLIDVGANLGLVALAAAAHGSRVIAVELLPENSLCLQLAILENRLRNIILFPLAAGAQPGLIGSAGSEAWGRIVPFGDGPTAAMLPLDQLIESAELQRGGRFGLFARRPLLVKIDTEGSELAVLHGASRLIAERDPAFIVECITIEGRDAESDHHSRLVKTFLEERGYHLYLHRGRRLVPRRSDDLQEGCVCDFFASRRRYRDGARIGRFTIGRLDFAESIAWVAEMAEWPAVPHRLHAAGVIGRWHAEGRRAAPLDALRRQLADDADPMVAAAAAAIGA